MSEAKMEIGESVTSWLAKQAPGHWDTEDGAMMAATYTQHSRADLSMSDLSDFALANAQYMVSRDDLKLIVYQTAAKERIRWLSVQLALANARLAEARP